MGPPPTPCTCSLCSKHEDGFVLQTALTKGRHQKADEELVYQANLRVRAHLDTQQEPLPRHSEHNKAAVDLGDIPEYDQYYDDAGEYDSNGDMSDGSEIASVYEFNGLDGLEELIGSSDEEAGPHQGDERDDESEPDLLDDPEFIPRASVIREPGDDNDPDAGDDEAPLAMDDHPAIRNAYIRAFVASSFARATHKAVQMQLEGAELLLRSAQMQAPELDFPGLDRMVHTLSAAEKRLGVSTDHLITYYFICDTCWHPEHPRQLYSLETPTCPEPNCTGKLYTTKRLSSGLQKRIPAKLLPYVSLKKYIQHQLLRPGKWDQLQEWRDFDDGPEQVPPITTREHEQQIDPNKPMRDVYDGSAWRAVQAGLERRRGGRWEIEDFDVHELVQRFVSLPCGLLWQINIDW